MQPRRSAFYYGNHYTIMISKSNLFPPKKTIYTSMFALPDRANLTKS